MRKNILEKIELLAPLPQTIMNIENFKKRKDQQTEDLIEMIQKDLLCVSALLKISNSSFFGFNSKVETISRVINLLGMNFVIHIAISESINNVLKNDLIPYGIKCEEIMDISNLSLSLANKWLRYEDKELKDEISLAALLQESGKFILSEIIVSKDLTHEFIEKIKNTNDIAKVEKELLGITTSKTTAEIFRHWKLSSNLINMIEFVDDIENCEQEYKQKAQILDVIKTICNVTCAFSDESIELGLKKAKAYDLDVNALQKAIDFLHDNLLDTKEV